MCVVFQELGEVWCCYGSEVIGLYIIFMVCIVVDVLVVLVLVCYGGLVVIVLFCGGEVVIGIVLLDIVLLFEIVDDFKNVLVMLCVLLVDLVYWVYL